MALFQTYSLVFWWTRSVLQRCFQRFILGIILFVDFKPHHMIVGYYDFTLEARVFVRPSVWLSVNPSVRPSVFSFPDDYLSKSWWICTKLGMLIDIVEIWFGIADGQMSSISDSYLPTTCPYFRFQAITSVIINGFFTRIVCALILWRSGLGLLMGKQSVSCPPHNRIFVYGRQTE